MGTVEGMVSRDDWRGRRVWLLKGFKWQNKDEGCGLFQRFLKATHCFEEG